LEKKNFLTIGELAKLSGVNIKSLRYYDRIGVLPPAYVDSVTNYRYYSHNQISLLIAIQLCIELDIPLKNFNQYISEDKNTIYIDRLYNHGKQIATEKINQINRKLSTLEKLHNEALRADSLNPHQIHEQEFGDNLYRLIPYNGQQNEQSFNRILLHDFHTNNDFKPDDTGDAGILRIFEKGKSTRYLFYSVNIDTFPPETKENSLFVPAGKYLCRLCNMGDIDKAEEFFPQILNMKAVVFETELFSQHYNYTNPTYELSCYIFE